MCLSEKDIASLPSWASPLQLGGSQTRSQSLSSFRPVLSIRGRELPGGRDRAWKWGWKAKKKTQNTLSTTEERPTLHYKRWNTQWDQPCSYFSYCWNTGERKKHVLNVLNPQYCKPPSPLPTPYPNIFQSRTYKIANSNYSSHSYIIYGII